MVPRWRSGRQATVRCVGHRKERIALPTADVNVGRRAVERQRADLAIAFAAALDLDRHHPAPLLPRIWGLRGFEDEAGVVQVKLYRLEIPERASGTR